MRYAERCRHLAMALVAMGLLWLAMLNTTHAHELRPSIVSIVPPGEGDATVLTIRLRTNLEALISEIGSAHDDTDDAPGASRYDALHAMTSTALSKELRDYLPTLRDTIRIGQLPSGDPGRLHLIDASIPESQHDMPRDSVLTFTAELLPATTGITWQWAEIYGAAILRTDQSDVLFSQYLQPGQQSDTVPLRIGAATSDAALTAAVPQSQGSTFIDYVVVGFQHIIPKGMDHILFVIALFLLSPRFKPMLWQVSMFTLAHTLTLALGITGVLSLPASVVEPLIALSIAVVCVENLLSCRMGQWRLVLVFAFGLLHGLGFAGVLGDIGLSPGAFVQSLLAFNIGVEIGQVTVVLLCFLLAGWPFGTRPWYRTVVTTPASLLIGGIGLLWFVQRLPTG